MSSTDAITRDAAASFDERFIDRQMTGVIEAIMLHSYSLAHRGLVPSEAQIAGYIQSLDDEAVVQKIRRHPAAASTRALLADDATLLRWASLVGREAQ